MLELLNNYSLSEIVIFIIMLAFSLKGVIDFYDWATKRIREPINKEQSEREMRQKVLDTLESHNKQIMEMSKAINILLESDRDDIKS